MSALQLTEKDWQSWVVDAAKLFGWRIAHFRPAQTAKGWRTAMTGDPGFPDLVLVRLGQGRNLPGRLIFAELKVNAKVREEQAQWLDALREAGAEAYVWRPDDRDQVLDILRKPVAA